MRKLMLTIAAIAGMVVGGGTAWADTEHVFTSVLNSACYEKASASASNECITVASSGGGTGKFDGGTTLKSKPTNKVITFNVTPGCVVTGIDGVVFSHQKSGTYTLEAIYIDSIETNLITTAVTLPLKTAGESGDVYEFNWSGFEAYSSIQFYFNDSKEVQIGFTATYMDALPVTISSVSAATLSLPTTTTIPEGLSVYSGELSSDNATLNLNQVSDVLPANEGVVVYGEEGTYYFPIATEKAAGLENNSLVANLEEGTLPTGTTNYVLNKVGDNLGFYQLAEGKTLGARKAYLPIATSAAAPAVRVVFGDETGNVTGIQAITTEAAAEAPLYNLAGQKLQGRVAPGLYIQGGKKVWVK